ncbi:hypothetical protein F5050DRAFT_1464791 [Lentinula boryana]|uniref:Uncharacterized protein n=1 Tax=Lentinula boryana TaxID=40481 RepID=A0ABQ8PWP6_9AGAR|nr:hypothetical protein F5050DRAFT_1464791 [Lentinula boryana]
MGHTHNQNFSESLCKKVWAIPNGRLEASGHDWIEGQGSGQHIDKREGEEDDQYDAMGNKMESKKTKKITSSEARKLKKERMARKKRGLLDVGNVSVECNATDRARDPYGPCASDGVLKEKLVRSPNPEGSSIALSISTFEGSVINCDCDCLGNVPADMYMSERTYAANNPHPKVRSHLPFLCACWIWTVKGLIGKESIEKMWM